VGCSLCWETVGGVEGWEEESSSRLVLCWGNVRFHNAISVAQQSTVR